MKRTKYHCWLRIIYLLSSFFLTQLPWSFAQEMTPAKKMFVKGTDLFEQGDYRGALAAYEASYQIQPKASVLYNIAMCKKALGRYSESIADFKRYQQQKGADIPAERKTMVTQALAEMYLLVGQLVVTDAPDGAVVSINDQPRGKTPLPAPLVLHPGQHRVTVEKEGYKPLSVNVTVITEGTVTVRAELELLNAQITVTCDAPGATVQIADLPKQSCPATFEVPTGQHRIFASAPGRKPVVLLALATAGEISIVEAALPVDNELAPAMVSQSGSPLFKLGIGAMALGAGALALGGVFTAKAASHQDEAEALQEKNDPLQPSAECTEDQLRFNEIKSDELPRDKGWMVTGYVLGGALIVSGVILLLVNKKRTGKSESLAVRPGMGQITVSF